MLGLVTVDDAIEVIEDSSEDEKAIDTFGKVVLAVAPGVILLFLNTLLVYRDVFFYAFPLPLHHP